MLIQYSIHKLTQTYVGNFHRCTHIWYNVVNSLIINLGYYGIFYILYRANAVTFDMNTIILMFGFGMVLHYAISLIQEKVILRKRVPTVPVGKL